MKGCKEKYVSCAVDMCILYEAMAESVKTVLNVKHEKWRNNIKGKVEKNNEFYDWM